MNPFLQNHKLNLIKVHTKSYETKTRGMEDNVIIRYREIKESHFIEQQEKTSVYEIPYIENILFKELSSKGRDLLIYIMYNLPLNTDYINLKTDKLMKEMDISRPTLIKGISELQDVAIITRKSQSEYWINPLYLFKGNRIEFYNKECKECINISAEVYRDETK